MSKVAKAALGLMIVTMISKLLGFGRELVLASSYGASMYSDAYLIAMNIPTVIFGAIGAALTTTFIPMYFDINSSLGEKRALKFTNNIFNIVIVLCIALAIMGMIFTKQLVKVFAIGFEGQILNITIKFTRILLMGIVFSGVSFIMTGYLQIKNNFTIPGLITVPRNIIIMVSIILSLKYGPYVMVWGTLIALASEFLFQLPFAIKSGYKYRPYINIKDEHIKKAMILIGPVMIGVAVNQLNLMIDKTLASTLVEGSISALNYASKLYGVILGLFIASIGAVVYPMLSKLSSEKNHEEFSESVVKSVNSIVLLVVPISVGAIILSGPIVKILFERGEFDSVATSMTASALLMYSIGMVAFGLQDILGKVFFSLRDTKTPMINSTIAVVLNIVLNIVFVRYLKHSGLALATSISSIVCTILLFRSLKKKIGYFGQDKIVKTILKSIVSAAIMGISTYTIYSLLIKNLGYGSLNNIISVFCSVTAGAIVYGALVIVLKVDEISVIIDIVKNKLNNK